ncbi:MAG: aquaporin, partial [Phenylobacterium sp.]
GLTLAAIHIVGIQVTGVSVNPARSFGPAVLVGGEALNQLWLFLVAPPIGAILGALPFRLGLLGVKPVPSRIDSATLEGAV